MPVLRINATATGLALHQTPQSARLRLEGMAKAPGPAIIMVHGYKYAPGSKDHCPHRKIFGPGQHRWPKGLGFSQEQPDEGLGLAFGWYARGSLKKVHRRATQLGESLAVMITLLRSHAPERPVHIVAHSLGSEAALSALEHLPPGAVDRIILLTGASHKSRAEAMLDTPAGRQVTLLNVTSRENDLFDVAFERLVSSRVRKDCALGQGIDAPNALTLQVDCDDTLRGLAHLGYPVAPAARRICHWSAYQRPGIMSLYNDFLRSPDSFPLNALRQVAPARASARWSRLFPHNGPEHDLLPPLGNSLGWPERFWRSPLTGRKKNEHAY